MYDGIEALLAFSFFLFGSIVYFVVALFYLASLAKATKSIRSNNPVTYVSRAWAWTQLIPLWNIVAIVVYNAKMSTAVAVYNSDNNSSLAYPSGLGWALVFSFLYVWVPVFGWIAAIVVLIMFWIKVANVSAEAMLHKSSATH